MRLNTKGVALIVAIGLMVIMAGLITLLATRAVDEVRSSSDNLAVVQTLLLARGGANLVGQSLVGPIRDDLEGLVEAAAFSGVNSSNNWVFGGNGDEPDGRRVADELKAIAEDLQPEIDDLLCNAEINPSEGNAEVHVRFYVTNTACGETIPGDIKLPLPRFVNGTSRNGTGEFVPQSYALPYVLVSEGILGDNKRTIVLQGEYQLEMGRGSFAKYALFTNIHETANGGDIWFTDQTLFDGPVHTNQFFRFYKDAWFSGKVTSAGCSNPSLSGCTGSFNKQGGEFMNIGFKSVSNMNDPIHPSYTDSIFQTHAPLLTGGIDWASNFVPLPQNNVDQEAAAKVGGIYIDGDINKLSMWAGDSTGNVVTNGNADYQYIAVTYLKEVTEEVTREVQVQTGTSGGEWVWVTRGCGAGYIWQGNQWRWRDNTCNDRYEWRETPTYETQTVTETITTTREATDTFRYSSSHPDDLLVLEDGQDWNSDWTYARTWPDANGNTKEIRSGSGNVKFTGVIFAAGDIAKLTGPDRSTASSNSASDARPALASFAKLTVTADNDIRITGDLKYENPPCTSRPTRNNDRSVTAATCNNLNAQNVLGIYVDDGDVIIGHNNNDSTYNAPQNVVIHGVLMSGQGSVRVENSDRGSVRGDVNLIGGLIENFYGAFGTFNSSTGQSSTGYSRKFTYDQRMADGMAPPYFPVIVEDKLGSVFAFSYGQREQIY
ncbi:MAG: DUF4900 domain-containing protein [Trueperaceae bacterium]|nr:DUF4900 domain-containing protein [Trueperaceae bacterium]